MTRGEFTPSDLDSVLNVIGLSPPDPLDTFGEMWYQVFLWALFSSMLFHIIAALIAFCRLRKHTIGRWMPVAILVMGVLSPLTGGVVTSAVIAGVFRASDFVMMPFYALVWGLGQTIVVMFISFTRILATL
ncbi:transmembrane protein 170A-like [Gigantopelta aegis]|uniref:transmembrane protein 170A-like n=1 Tax=Gigantopelta aegis TaxID=1735272 RepID=UPI001B88CD6B|nr:transmembrane protein 170A-like [Gigantopelta aegis]XP_041376301.1 transmembrane protein 170A-like [Gigantopelta aegis]